jgi:hypothetical protein
MVRVTKIRLFKITTGGFRAAAWINIDGETELILPNDVDSDVGEALVRLEESLKMCELYPHNLDDLTFEAMCELAFKGENHAVE